MKQLSKYKFQLRVIFVFLIVLSAIAGIYDFIIPNEISVFASEDISSRSTLPFVSYSVNATDTAYDVYKKTQADATLLGVVPIKKIDVNVYKDMTLYPGGIPFGVRFYTQGVIVVGMSEIETAQGAKNPAYEAGIRIKDNIIKINDMLVNTIDDVTSIIEKCEGNRIKLTVLRDGEEMSFALNPQLSLTDNVYKSGVWVRDSTAGIGTVTFINPTDNSFGGLGHGICDIDTGQLMPMLHASVTNVSVNGINKGVPGNPGELKGHFNTGKTGTLMKNTDCGVFGIFSSIPNLYSTSPLPVGLSGEVKAGGAYILTTLDSTGPQKYSIEIEEIKQNSNDPKNFTVKVTDPSLIEKTGGIVQGMSGSPIIQNGKLIGAVTHVFVNDPTRGYGIFIENMLDMTK